MSDTRDQSSWRNWIQLLLGLGLTLLFFYMMAPFMVPFLLGAVAAILCYPFYSFLSKFVPKYLSAFCTTLMLTAGVLLPVVYLTMSGSYRIVRFLSRLRILREGQTIEHLTQHPLIQKSIAFISRWLPVDQDWMHSQALDLLGSTVERLSGTVAALISGMPSLLMALGIVLLSTFFFLLDGSKFLRFLASLSPMKLDRSRDLYSTFERSCRGVVLALFISGIVQGILMAFLFTVTGLPDPLFILFLTIVAGMIPIVGSAPIWIAAVIYHVSQGKMAFAIVMFLGGLAVSTSDNIVRPVVMKGHAEMHPLLALVSVFGAINLFGPTGIFLGPIIAAVFVSFLRILSIELRRELITKTEGTSV